MAEKLEPQSSPYPLASSDGYPRSDTEAPAATYGGSGDQRRRKNNRTKCILYIILFAVFQTGMILLFTLTVTKIRTPKFRVRSAAFDNFTAAAPPANPSLDSRMVAELAVKNTNFGRFKFKRTTVYFYYGGARIGEAEVARGTANWRSTTRFDVVVDLSVAAARGVNSDQLASDLRAGVVPITSEAKLWGNVRVVMLLKKKRVSDMNCSMEIVTATRRLRNVVCD